MSRSPMSPWTKTCAGLSFSDASVSRLPAYVRASRLTTRTPLATASSTKLPPMKPAPPVTSQVGTLELLGILGGPGETVARPAVAAMRPGKHGNRHEQEIRDRRLRDEPWLVGQSRLPPHVDGVPRSRNVQPGLVAIPTAKGRAAAVTPAAGAAISSENRSEKRHEGQEYDRTFRTRWMPYHYKKKK